MDFLSLETDNKGVKDVLVMTDHFTKYAIAVSTKNQTAKVVAEALWDNLISHYEWPARLHSDQGRDCARWVGLRNPGQHLITHRVTLLSVSTERF